MARAPAHEPRPVMGMSMTARISSGTARMTLKSCRTGVRIHAGETFPAARKAKVDAGLRFSKLNLGPATFLETLTESYYEVVSPPYGEGLVGKKFPWAYTVMCRSDGGEEW